MWILSKFNLDINGHFLYWYLPCPIWFISPHVQIITWLLSHDSDHDLGHLRLQVRKALIHMVNAVPVAQNTCWIETLSCPGARESPPHANFPIPCTSGWVPASLIICRCSFVYATPQMWRPEDLGMGGNGEGVVLIFATLSFACLDFHTGSWVGGNTSQRALTAPESPSWLQRSTFQCYCIHRIRSLAGVNQQNFIEASGVMSIYIIWGSGLQSIMIN